MRRSWFHSVVAMWVASAIVTQGCRSPGPAQPVASKPAVVAPSQPPPVIATGARPVVALTEPDDNRGVLALHAVAAPVAQTSAPITALSKAEADALLARLEPLPDLSTKPAPIVRPPAVAPARSTPATPIAFVAPTAKQIADAPASAAPKLVPPLAEPDIYPRGETSAESTVRIRFDEPMVPVAAVGNVATIVPATIVPAVPGHWRWLDTHVAEFETTQGRFPMATEFTVTVAAGVRAVSGSALGNASIQKFATAGPRLVGLFPDELRPDSPILLTFDQEVEPAAIAAFVDVQTTPAHATGKVKLAPQAHVVTTLADARAAWAKNSHLEIPADLAKQPGRVVVLAPKTAWPSGSELTAAVRPGAPSHEGPRTTVTPSSRRVEVVPKFVELGLECDELATPHANPQCRAGGVVSVVLANAFEAKLLADTAIALAGSATTKRTGSSRRLAFPVPDTVGKTFTIKVAATGIVDVYGQPLADPHDLAFTTIRPRPEVPSPYLDTHFGSTMFVLDPRFAVPQWVVDVEATTGLRVELYRVEPQDWFAYAAFEEGKRKTPPGKRVFDTTYPVGATQGGTLRQDLRVALDPKTHTGHVIAVATALPVNPKASLEAHAWIQVTKLGVTARYDDDAVNAWIDSIAPDAGFLHPVATASAELLVKGRTGAPPAAATDGDGHARFVLPERVARATPAHARATTDEDDDNDGELDRHGRLRRLRDSIVIARANGDSVFALIGAADRMPHHTVARWYVTDDRFLYRPGEPVSVKGWLRWTHDGVNPDLSTPASGTVAWSLVDSRGTTLVAGDAPLTDQGGFDLTTTIPATAQLGRARLELSTAIPDGKPGERDSYEHTFAIEEFRTPAYAVTFEDDVGQGGGTPLVAGESIEMGASAAYFGGGGLGGAKVKWDVELHPTQYRPPGWDGFSFRPPSRDRETTAVHEEMQLSSASAANVVIAIPAVPLHQPAILAVDATVTDVDRQTIRASSHPIVVHPSAYYVGVRVRPGSTTQTGGDLELVITDIDGKPVPNVAIDVAIEGRSRDEQKPAIDTQHCALASAAAPVACAYTRRDPSYGYRAVATVADPRKRTNATAFDVPWWSPPADAEFELSSDKARYRVGEVAKVTVHSKLVPATAVVTFARQGVIGEKRVELATAATVVDVPIDAAFVTNVHVVVDRFAKRADSPLPEHLTTAIDLEVDLDSVRLDTTARALTPVIEPGAQAAFEVTVAHGGKPVANAEVALIVVDEAVLSLSGRVHADPLPEFYSHVDDGTSVVDTFDLVTDASPDLAGAPGWDRWDLATHGSVRMGVGRGGARGHTSAVPTVSIGSPSASIKARKDFRATAVFSPRLHTDAAGKAVLSVKMPDSLTRFRVVALATATGRWFGKAEGTIATRLPINARIVAPRFLTQGDAFGLPVVVQNLDKVPRTVSVAVRAANLATVGATGKRVALAGGQRAEVRFELATIARGAAAIQTVVASDGTTAVDASVVGVQVYEPATTESFATYGVVDDKPRFEQLAVPTDIYPEVGGVEAEVSSTQLQSLTDAYWYVYGYPYECAEQRSARMLATTAIVDLLDAFATPGRPTRAAIAETRSRDIDKLVKDQNTDGGWNFYRGMKSDPFITQQVLAALATGKEAPPAIAAASAYVTGDTTRRLGELERSARLPIAARRTREQEPYDVAVVAAALATLATTGADVKPRAARLHAAAIALDAYPIDAKARVLALLARQPAYAAQRAKLVGDLLGAVRETAGSATITAKTVEAERLLFVSSAKTTALAIDALIRETPNHPAIVKLARGVLDARAHGRWATTQENLVVLQAMRRYFDTYEKVTPNYTGKLWFGTAAYAEQAFVGRSNARGRVAIGWPTLGLGTTHDLAIDKTGEGRLYYRVGITYAPKQVDLPALDAGFVVRRTYVPVDDPKDVVRAANGTWHVKLGARVVVQLEVINTARRDTVGLADPLPAGFEPVNTRLATAERAAATSDGWDAVTLRDNRAEAFASSLAEGAHRFAYTVRVTTPGTFIAAPAKAEEMYAPETFGRSAGAIVVVE